MKFQSSFFKTIQQNIKSHGVHITLVKQSSVPRYAYTIGLYPVLGYELILAGDCLLSGSEVFDILNYISKNILENENKELQSLVHYEQHTFIMQTSHNEWSFQLALGAMDYYKLSSVPILQVLPSRELYTIDVPDMTSSLIHQQTSCWNVLISPWPYNISPTSTAIADVYALKGSRITELMRVEEDEWEMFSGPGPNFDSSEVRVVPINVLLSHDQTLKESLTLEIGKGLYRDEQQTSWQQWG